MGIDRYSLSRASYFPEYWNNFFQIFINRYVQIHLEKAKNKDKIKVLSGYILPHFILEVISSSCYELINYLCKIKNN